MSTHVEKLREQGRKAETNDTIRVKELGKKKLIDIGVRYGLQWIWKSGFGRFPRFHGIRTLDV
ncbi:MAG: hypothetical protein Q8941_00225 [Bacteroidota bacterium]|nr:hypothetical protein [Bacteroidota bacterium]